MATKNTLRDRAAGSEVATRGTGADLPSQIKQMEAQFQLAMPRGVEAKQLVRDALTAIRMTPKLAEADPRTILGALMTCAQLGLRPGVLGHAWVLPFYDTRSRSQKAQLVIGYQGLVELAHRSGKIQSLIARTVFENDEFDVDYGLEDRLVHKPNLHGSRGRPIAYYAIVKLTTGGRSFIVMTQSDMEAHRDAFAMAKTKEGKIVGPWRDNFEAMAHKTCVLRLAKWMPKGTDLAVAVAADEGVRIDLDPAGPAESTTVHYDEPTLPDEGTIDGEAVEYTPAHEEVLALAQTLGMTLWNVEDRFASTHGGLRFTDATHGQLTSFLDELKAEAAA